MRFYDGKFLYGENAIFKNSEVETGEVLHNLLLDDYLFNAKPIEELIRNNDELSNETKNSMLHVSNGFAEVIDDIRAIRIEDNSRYAKKKSVVIETVLKCYLQAIENEVKYFSEV